MNLQGTKKRENVLTARTSLMAITLTILVGCENVPLDLEAAREEINPRSAAHADSLVNGTRQQAAKTGRDLIASIDCLLKNPECPTVR